MGIRPPVPAQEGMPFRSTGNLVVPLRLPSMYPLVFWCCLPLETANKNPFIGVVQALTEKDALVEALHLICIVICCVCGSKSRQVCWQEFASTAWPRHVSIQPRVHASDVSMHPRVFNSSIWQNHMHA